MKKTIKILFIFIFSLALFSIGNKVEANSIQSIAMDIFIDDNGDATVTETWRCNVTQGTEVYHPYYNLGNSVIKDLTVMDGTTQYEQLSSWDTSGTLQSKANKCGINVISNGVELCWGISQYGSHTYTTKYTITNFVSETTDAQMIYWTLIPYEFSNSIGNAYIKIHTNFDIEDTTDVWGYGNYGGTAYVYDGYIEMQSDGTLEKNEYMTILVKFPLGTFNAINKLDYDFDNYYNMAQEGAIEYTEEDISIGYVIAILVVIFGAFVIIIILLVHAFNMTKGLDYGKEGKKIPKIIPYFRDIPCKRDIFRAYYIGYQYDIVKEKTNILGAIILKWLKDGIVRIEERSTSLKKENIAIVFTRNNSEMFLESKEKELFDMMYEASEDGILEGKELEIWCDFNYSKIVSWLDKVIDDERDKLVNQGLIEEKIKGKRKKYIATYELKQEAIELAGLRKYLNEYTLIKDRKAVEVQLFEEYLIFAQIMGIAKKVSKQFKDIYPQIIQQSNFVSYDSVMFINTSLDKGIYTARERISGYSSGGGGFSSGGGGGGSFGGGRGGRRLPLKLKDYTKVLINTCQK